MLYIMRHGRTDWNAAHKLQGCSDIPLNNEGRHMAEEAHKKYKDLKFDVCYCSPLIRARETAEIFLRGTNVPIIEDKRLHEMSFGIYEGVEHVTDKPDCSVYTLFKDPVNYVADGGAESIEQLYARTGSFINETLKPALAENKNILIVGHGAMNSSIICQLKNYPLKDFWTHLQGNCEVLKLI